MDYRLDTLAKTATLVWEYGHVPPVDTPFLGSVQRMHNGTTLVGWGGAWLAAWVSADGALLWEGQLLLDARPGTFFRMIALPSLYMFQRA